MYPKPIVAPVNSPITTPTTANVEETLSEETTNCVELGILNFKRIYSFVAEYDFIKLIFSFSTTLNPSRELINTGKNAIIAPITIFE